MMMELLTIQEYKDITGANLSDITDEVLITYIIGSHYYLSDLVGKEAFNKLSPTDTFVQDNIKKLLSYITEMLLTKSRPLKPLQGGKGIDIYKQKGYRDINEVERKIEVERWEILIKNTYEELRNDFEKTYNVATENLPKIIQAL